MSDSATLPHKQAAMGIIKAQCKKLTECCSFYLANFEGLTEVRSDVSDGAFDMVTR